MTARSAVLQVLHASKPHPKVNPPDEVIAEPTASTLQHNPEDIIVA